MIASNKKYPEVETNHFEFDKSTLSYESDGIVKDHLLNPVKGSL